MKKATIFVTTIILALACIFLAGCTKPDNTPKTPAYSVNAATRTEFNNANVAAYNDGYHTDDYFIVVLLTTANVATMPILSKDTNAFNFMLLRSNENELLETMRPIEPLCSVRENYYTVYTLVFHSNYTLTEGTFNLSIALGNSEYKILPVR